MEIIGYIGRVGSVGRIMRLWIFGVNRYLFFMLII